MSDKRSTPRSGKLGIFIGGILLVAAVIAFVSLDGYPPADQDSVGAIGAAKRYRSEQITESDVQLQDAEAVALLQSDEFQKLIRDEEFQKAVRDQNWAIMMHNDRFRRIFLDDQFLQVLSEGDVSKRLQDANYMKLQPDEAYKVFLAKLEEAEINVRGERLSQLVADDEFKHLFTTNAVFRGLILDEELLRQRLDEDVVAHQVDMNWNNIRPQTEFAKLAEIYTDASIAGRNPRLPELAADAEFKQLFENQALAARVVLDAKLEKLLLDQELRRKFQEADWMKLSPEDAYADLLKATRAAEMASPRLSVDEMATDAQWQQFFQHEMAAKIALDVDFFQPLVDASLASRLGPLAYANLAPQEKYVEFLKAVEAANLSVPKDRLIEVASDAKFASWFREDKFLQAIVLDDAFARKFYEVALYSRRLETELASQRPQMELASQRPQVELASQRPQTELINLRPQTELINLRPEERFNGWMQIASDMAMNTPERSIQDYAVDGEFKKLVEDQEWGAKFVTDQNLMRVLLETNLATRLATINYLEIRPEVALQHLQTAVAEAKLNNPAYDVDRLVHDADFVAVFMQNSMLRRIMYDANYARQAVEAGLASRFSQLELVNLRPTEAYLAIWDAAKDAQMEGRNARVASWAADAEFKSMFQNMNLASQIVLDDEMMHLMVESGFATAADRADLRTVVSDADLLSRYYVTE